MSNYKQFVHRLVASSPRHRYRGRSAESHRQRLRLSFAPANPSSPQHRHRGRSESHRQRLCPRLAPTNRRWFLYDEMWSLRGSTLKKNKRNR